MGISYELIRKQDGLPIRVFIHSVESLNMHWHKELEILLVLKGSVSIRKGSERYVIRENDLTLINSHEIHNTSRTDEDNIVLAIQIDLDYYSENYPGFNRILFNCESSQFQEDDQEIFDPIRHHLARIVWESNKKQEGFQLVVGSEVQLLLAHLINNCKGDKPIQDEAIDNDRERIQGIVDYINENMAKGVTLQEIAEREHLNPYYLSHFIKRALGISFQEYLNFIRLESVTKLLLNTDKTIMDISFESGFPSTKSLNRIFKREYDLSPTGYRKLYRKVKENGLDNGIDLEKLKSKTYLDVDRNIALGKLFTYLQPLDNNAKELKLQSSQKQSIIIDTEKEGATLKAYWTFIDLMEESKAGISPFHGGFGLINNQGIKKSFYIAYNFAYFDNSFLNGDISALSKDERYLIYENKPLKEITLNVEGLSGNYKISRYKLNRENGSSFDEWIRMGAPENMTREEVDYLKGRAYPKMDLDYLKIDGDHKEILKIPVYGAELIRIERIL